jgi:hypothetical protein
MRTETEANMGSLLQPLSSIARLGGSTAAIVQGWEQRGHTILRETDVPAGGKGHPSFVSFETAMQVSIALAAQRLGCGIERALLLGLAFVGATGECHRIRRGPGGEIAMDDARADREPCALFPGGRTLFVIADSGAVLVHEADMGAATALQLGLLVNAESFAVLDVSAIWRRVAPLYGRD